MVSLPLHSQLIWPLGGQAIAPKLGCQAPETPGSTVLCASLEIRLKQPGLMLIEGARNKMSHAPGRAPATAEQISHHPKPQTQMRRLTVIPFTRKEIFAAP